MLIAPWHVVHGGLTAAALRPSPLTISSLINSGIPRAKEASIRHRSLLQQRSLNILDLGQGSEETTRRDKAAASAMRDSQPLTPVLKDLVLLGGGHAHVEVLRSFGMDPLPGLRITLITKDVHTAYSGMLPGFVAGYYSFDECHVDLLRLCNLCGVQFVHATAKNIDPKAQKVLLEGREAISYDILSVDVGITPSGQGIKGSLDFSTPVKPVSSFVERLNVIKKRHAASDHPLEVVVVGGGAGGVELSLSMHHYLKQPVKGSANSDSEPLPAHLTLISRSKILTTHPSSARAKFLRIMKEKGMTVREDCAVKEVKEGKVVTLTGEDVAFDECLWCTQAGAPDWLKATGLPLDDKGFLAIGSTLQCEGGPENVFACGDVASCAEHPRPKAGVYAVRQGPPLTQNLRNFLKGEQLQPYLPQTTSLGLITTGDRYAIATKGWFCLEGAYLWNWKDKIDRGWMEKYGDKLPSMDRGSAQSEVATDAEAERILQSAAMRCGGCGAKVGASVLSRALARLPKGSVREDILVGLDARDDAAVVLPPPAGHVMVQTVDFFRSFISDPYEFGAVAANNALGPSTALAMAVVPFGTDSKVEETLFHLMAGALKVLNAAGCALVGGHTCEGDEHAGFSINGTAKRDELLRKGGAKPGQTVVMTKAVGTGILMAASMRGKAKGRWVTGAVASMQQSSAEAAAILRRHGATACTDVTGFGLLGHLQEIALASQVSIQLETGAVRCLEGAAECAADKVASSLAPQNARVSSWLQSPEQAEQHEKWPLLVDPQTGGGLLATIPEGATEACISELMQAGYREASVIGKIRGSLGHQIVNEQPEAIIDII